MHRLLTIGAMALGLALAFAAETPALATPTSEQPVVANATVGLEGSFIEAQYRRWRRPPPPPPWRRRHGRRW
jgi:hypothetical protein